MAAGKGLLLSLTDAPSHLLVCRFPRGQHTCAPHFLRLCQLDVSGGRVCEPLVGHAVAGKPRQRVSLPCCRVPARARCVQRTLAPPPCCAHALPCLALALPCSACMNRCRLAGQPAARRVNPLARCGWLAVSLQPLPLLGHPNQPTNQAPRPPAGQPTRAVAHASGAVRLAGVFHSKRRPQVLVQLGAAGALLCHRSGAGMACSAGGGWGPWAMQGVLEAAHGGRRAVSAMRELPSLGASPQRGGSPPSVHVHAASHVYGSTGCAAFYYASAGLLGGAVYVNAFTLISAEVPPQYRCDVAWCVRSATR